MRQRTRTKAQSLMGYCTKHGNILLKMAIKFRDVVLGTRTRTRTRSRGTCILRYLGAGHLVAAV